MRDLIARLIRRFSPRVLRSNNPQMPFVMRRRHWLLEETRFLLLTRRGPVELVIKPTYIAAAAFVGLVGTVVIAATTIFVGYNAVEVVSNDTISTAEASIPITEPSDIEAEFALLAQEELARADASAAGAEAHDAPPVLTIDPRVVESAAVGPQVVDPQVGDPPQQFAALAAPKLIPLPVDSDAGTTPAVDEAEPVNDDAPLEAASQAPTIEMPVTAAKPQSATTALIAMFKSPFTSPFEADDLAWMKPGSQRRARNDAATETVMAPRGNSITVAMNPPAAAAMVPFAPDSQMPVLNAAVRQHKLLRSMVREVRLIRSSLIGLGIASADLPPEGALDTRVDDADFAGLLLAVEGHRSALRKVPLKPPMLYFYISSNYGKRRHPVSGKTRMHHGIDLAGTWQEEVQASAPGTVIFAGKMGSFGNVVRIQHDFDITTTYAHLSRISIAKGADVVPGTVIGKMGRTGRVDGAHLHYEIRVGGKSVNPQNFFDIGHRIGIGGELLQAAATN